MDGEPVLRTRACPHSGHWPQTDKTFIGVAPPPLDSLCSSLDYPHRFKWQVGRGAVAKICNFQFLYYVGLVALGIPQFRATADAGDLFIGVGTAVVG
jgi:hypothetical protein